MDEWYPTDGSDEDAVADLSRELRDQTQRQDGSGIQTSRHLEIEKSARLVVENRSYPRPLVEN